MENNVNIPSASLKERILRNEEVFFSILIDEYNKTLRVIDFRGGNIQEKHKHVEVILKKEKLNRIFTIIERDDIAGWQKCGYAREGSIPGYYKRSDGYLMGRVYEKDFDEEELSENNETKRKILAEIDENAQKMTGRKPSSLTISRTTHLDALKLVTSENSKLQAKTKGEKQKTKSNTPYSLFNIPTKKDLPLIFPQFSRDAEYLFFHVTNKRIKHNNLFGVEYQDCFGNAKVDMFFSPALIAEKSLATAGLIKLSQRLADLGVVALFSMVSSHEITANTIFAASGFKNSGWLHRHKKEKNEYTDMILWTKKNI